MFAYEFQPQKRQKTLYDYFGSDCPPEFRRRASTTGGKKKAKRKRLEENDSKEIQMVIDAGQKNFLPILCDSCKLLYNPNNPDDMTEHQKLHVRFDQKLTAPLPRYLAKKLPEVDRYDDGFICMFDNKSFAPKMREWLDNAYRLACSEVGLSNDSPLPLYKPKQQIYVFCQEIKGISITGIMCVEPVQKAYFQLDDGSIEERSRDVVFGVSLVWVCPLTRRKKVATRLLDCARNNYLRGFSLSKSDFAFSDFLPDGLLFAKNYCDNKVLIFSAFEQ
ncbi:unnamed protein product [Soboliphyme baturini]|uniref:N-acetyltransferase ESCO1 n=1 Tax=Soboliphyme baturini TaxID=241478 RepID=A0A183IKJ1_9BILA|nr:unnamed protein product [Soboliphyme baturini]